MKPNKPISKAFPSLADIEREVVAESREWAAADWRNVCKIRLRNTAVFPC